MKVTTPQNPVLALRVARDDEGDVIRRIADLDDARTLSGEVLLAVVDGEPIAARSLRDGRVVANPFVRTADAVALLDIRASQLTAARQRHRSGLARISRRPAA
jgi:hypothetical protein